MAGAKLPPQTYDAGFNTGDKVCIDCDLCGLTKS